MRKPAETTASFRCWYSNHRHDRWFKDYIVYLRRINHKRRRRADKAEIELALIG